ncbi:MAG TPA: NAD-dependent malic enzyme [Candidatus Limnocylindria bacterium]
MTTAPPVLTPAYRIVMRLEIANRPGMFAEVARTIGARGCSLGAIDLVEATPAKHIRDVTVDAPDEETGEKLAADLRKLKGVAVRSVSDRTFLMHLGGKVAIAGRVSVRTRDDLSLVYTPGVARVSRAIAADPERSWSLTQRANAIAIVSDGTAVLGLGNVGPLAALPVMEGKSLLFADLAHVSAFPLVIKPGTPREIVDAIERVSIGFGGINLEDIAAPACFEIERELRARLEIPVFHDDQHGTAVVVLAGLLNAAAVCDVGIEGLRVVVLGAGAAGTATARLLRTAGVTRIAVLDRHGTITSARADLNEEKHALAAELGSDGPAETLAEAIVDAHVFIGLSGPRLLTLEMVRSMARPRIVFALANPEPEIDPVVVSEEVEVLATGRSDYPNQVNNVLAFPGIFRGLLDARARTVTTGMELAAASALADTVPARLRSAEYILPSVFDRRVVPAIARAVATAARADGVARRGRMQTTSRPAPVAV